jgi:hypothetical protein
VHRVRSPPPPVINLVKIFAENILENEVYVVTKERFKKDLVCLGLIIASVHIMCGGLDRRRWNAGSPKKL